MLRVNFVEPTPGDLDSNSKSEARNPKEILTTETQVVRKNRRSPFDVLRTNG
jgi:hypothetical protein